MPPIRAFNPLVRAPVLDTGEARIESPGILDRIASLAPPGGRCSREKRRYAGRLLREPLERRPRGEERFAKQTKSPGMGFSSERTPEAIAEGREREAAE